MRTELFAFALLTLSACTGSEAPKPEAPSAHSDHDHDGHDHDGHDHDHDGHDHDHDEHGDEGGDGHGEGEHAGEVELSEAARVSLGVAFGRVERRRVAQTARAPGRFELLPTGRFALRAAAPGRVALEVGELEAVAAGQRLGSLDSPSWRALQAEMAEAARRIKRADARLRLVRDHIAAVEAHRRQLEAQERVWVQRLAQLDELMAAGSGAASEMAQARAELTGTRTQLAEVGEERAEAELEKQEASLELEAAWRATPRIAAQALGRDPDPKGGVDLLLSRAAALTGLSVAELCELGERGPRWSQLERIPLLAPAAGRIEAWEVDPGAWVVEGEALGRIVDGRRLRFRAEALQADLGWLRDGLEACVIAPYGQGDERAEGLRGRVTLAPVADPESRRIDLILALDPEAARPAWARAGVAAELELVVAGGEATLAVPARAVLRDGLERVLFLRERDEPDHLRRVALRCGATDGRWIAVEASGGAALAEGDEVVVEGAYGLLLGSSTQPQAGAHVHADGTVHSGEH